MKKDYSNLPSIDFFILYSKLVELKPDIEISYLTVQEIFKVQNFPIKENHSFNISEEDLVQIENNGGICLVIMSTINIDQEINNKLQNIPGIKYQEVWYLNKKMAAVTSGLGQYGKNQLVYNSNFGFDHSISTFLIYNPIKNLFIHSKANYNYLDLCKNCNECEKNCPVKAINCSDYPFWLNENKCRNFYNFGEHPTIPSLKYGINAFLGHPYSDTELKQVTNHYTFKQLFGFENRESRVDINNNTYIIDVDFCRECMNQKPCRKKEHTYTKDFYKIVEEKPYDPLAVY